MTGSLSADYTAVLDGSCPLGPDQIGGKAWGINRMRALGLPVPPAFVVTTQACREYHLGGATALDRLWPQIAERMNWLEQAMGRRFGAGPLPLLVSVRSGAARSMPGMMDTILNLGINREVEALLAARTGDPDYASGTHGRFIEQYRRVVLGGLEDPVPVKAWEQLRGAVSAVFDSWHSPRARVYRKNRNLPNDGCTAVTIQAMVFGNRDSQSGTGVLFSRNPITGEGPAWGEWLPNAQGEEVVSGSRTPQPLALLRDQMPAVHAQLLQAAARLEADARDIQDIEFTVESGRLWLLQARVAKRSPQAAVRAAVAFVEDGLISKEEALRRLDADVLRQLPALQLAPQASAEPPLAVGESACPGVATGLVVTDPEDTEVRARRGEDVILARTTTSPDDLHGIIAARALITEQGGSASHAAVVSREIGRPCVVGCGSNTVTRLAGQRVTVDGASGRVWRGNLAVERANDAAIGDLRKLLAWGLPLVPIELLQVSETPPDAVDLDALGPTWKAALKPGMVVRGEVLETDEGVRAVMAAGVRAAVVRDRLPALIACLQSASASATDQHEAIPSFAAQSSELALLRLLGMKRRAAVEIVADSLAELPEITVASYKPLCARGLCTLTGNVLQLTTAGRSRLAQLLEEERSRADAAAVIALYEEFCVFNAELKQILTAWQLKADGTPNDHADPGYDRGVLQRLAKLHSRAAPLIRRLSRLSARLDAYGARLERAAARIAAGDHSFVAKLLADSYHTVWFELHEDLLGLMGLTRSGQEKAASCQNNGRGL
jgi:pyruvate,orthophosphate dikinase